MMRAAIYVRVSSADQVEGRSLEGQIADLRRFADYKALEITDELVFVEEGVSGRLESRPAFDLMLSAAKAGAFDYLLVWKLSRFARNARAALNALDVLERAGVKGVYFSQDGLDTSTKANRALVIPVLAGVAEIESENIREQAGLGKRQTALAGGWNGGLPPFGYRLEPAPQGRGKVLAVNDEAWQERSEADVVRMVFELAKQGRSALRIARELERRGIPAPSGWPGRSRRGREPAKRWDPPTLSRMIANPAYMGTIRWRKTTQIEPRDDVLAARKLHGNGRRYKIKQARPAEEHFEMSCPAIIDSAEYAAAQRMVGVGDRAKPKRFPYPLSHRIVCDECGSRFIGVSYGKDRKRRYMCGGRHWRHEDRCANRTLQAEKVEDPVWQIVTRILSEPGWLEARIRATYRPARKSKGDELKRLVEEFDAKRRQGDRLTRSHTACVITDDRFERVMRELQAEEQKLRRRIEALEAQAERTRGALLAAERIAELALKGRRRLDRLGPEERAQVLALLLAEVRVPAEGAVKLRVTLPLEEAWSQKWARQDLNL